MRNIMHKFIQNKIIIIMCREERSFASARESNYCDLCGDFVKRFTEIAYGDYRMYGRPKTGHRWISLWISERKYEKYGISAEDASSIVMQAENDGYMRWIREKIKKCVK